MRCDRVLVLENGSVAAVDAPARLLVSSPWFSGLSKLQRLEEVVG